MAASRHRSASPVQRDQQLFNRGFEFMWRASFMSPRLVSWNLNVRDAAFRDDKVRLISAHPWDVLALQEVDPDTFRFIADAVPGAGVYRADDERRAGPDYGSALFVGPSGRIVASGLVSGLAWPERGVWADVEFADAPPVRFVSFHAPNAAGQGGDVKMAAYRAIHQFVRSTTSPLILAMDANAHWDVFDDQDDDHWRLCVEEHSGDPAWEWHRLLLAPDDYKADEHRTGLRDAWRDVLRDDPERRGRQRAARPHGPTAVTHVTNGWGHVRPWRYDYVYVSGGIAITGMEHHYEDAIVARSDHALIETSFTVTEPSAL